MKEGVVDMLATYGIPDEQLRDIQNLAPTYGNMQEVTNTTDRRGFLRALGASGIVTASLIGGATVRTLLEPLPIDIPPAENPEPLSSGEPIGEFALSFFDRGRAYISLDEVSHLAEKGEDVDLHIEGSDMEQYYKIDTAHKDASGVDIVKRDGFAFIRFTIRPSDTRQNICSTIGAKNKSSIAQPIDSTLIQYHGAGNTPAYFESATRLTKHADELQRHFDMLNFLFPNQPFLTVRRPNNDEIILPFRAKNTDAIPLEFPITNEDLAQVFSDNSLLAHFRTMTEAFVIGLSSKDDIGYKKFLDAAHTIDAASHTLITKTYGKWPTESPMLLTRNIRNYIFHPATYTDKIDSNTPLFQNTEHILASLFYLLRDEKLVSELLKRVNELSTDTQEGSLSLASDYNYIRAIIGTSFEVACTPNKPAAFKAFPQLQRVYDELSLDALLISHD